MIAPRRTGRLAAVSLMLLSASAGPLSVAGAAEPVRLAPAAATPADPAGPLIRVRAGEHAAFSRLVVDWTVPVGYAVAESDGRVSVTFDRSATLAVERIARRSLPGVSSLTATRDAGGHPTLSFAADGRIRHFRDGTRIVVDVMRAKDVAARPADATASAAPAAPERVAPPPAAAQAVAAPAGIEAVANGAPEVARTEPAMSPVGTTDRRDGPALGVLPNVLTLLATPPAEAPSDAPRRTGAPLDVEVEAEKDSVRMSFPFDAPVSAATFRRGGHLWLVFDAATRVDTVKLVAQVGRFASRIDQLGHPDATVLRIETEPGFNPSIASDGNHWNFFLAPQTLKPDTALDVNPPATRDAALSVTTASPGAVLQLHDPEVGDTFHVVPVRDSGHGVARHHEFVDFALLKSAQGVAIKAFSDRLDVRGRADGVFISAIGGLRLSPPADRARLLAIAAVEGPPDALFDFHGWRRTGEGEFDEVRQSLIEQLLGTSREDRNLARLDLARFYFAHGLVDRTTSVLTEIARDDAEMARVPSFRALKGASRLLMGDLAAARADLFYGGLDTEAEIQVWRGMLMAAEGDFAGAAIALHDADRFVGAYPHMLRARFGLATADVALAIDDIRNAGFWLEFLKTTSLTASQTARRELIAAQVAAAEGQTEQALALFDRLATGSDRYGRARGSLDRINLMLRDQRITVAEATEQLDRLRYAWRGDALELAVLRRLGELQIEAGNYRDGLLTLKQAVTNFAEDPSSPAITEAMRATFRRLYIDGDAEELPAVTAIALFNEFRELAPVGAEGDEMIGRLADRMIGVDLLDQAAALLSHQIEFRLQGVEKATAGTRLAVVRLLDRKARAALEALDASRVAGLPDELARERQMIGARAHAELGDKARALSYIAGDRSEPADRLRAEILWRARDWGAAAEVLVRLAGAPPPAGTPLAEPRARHVLNGAVALVLAGDQDRLSRIRREFGAAMEATALAADFRIIVAADRTARDFDDVLKRIATVDDFDAFVKNYRARLLAPQKVSAAKGDGAPG
jgi:hypothetical protein